MPLIVIGRSPMSTLWAALESLPDRRTKKGRRYSLASIVTLSLAAMLSGANDLRAIFRWGRRLTPKSLEMLGIDRGKAPCHATYHYVFQSIAAEDLERALRGMVPAGGLGHVAIDGERLRGSQHETSPGVHMLHAFATGLQMTVGSLAVPPDSGEVTQALKLIKGLPLDGAIVTGDAAFTFAPLCAAIRENGGHYFFFVKGNQPELQAELAYAFGDDSPLKTSQLPRPKQRSNRSTRSHAA
jgi:predicted transposase YbfD/YdcC